MVTMDAPAAPVSVAEAKAYLRIAGSEEDAVIAGLIRTAAELCESFTGRVLVVRPVREVVAGTGAWTRLSAAPVQAIETARALSADGTARALSPEEYGIDVDAGGDGWVRLPRGLKRVEIGYRAGLAADANGLPEALRQGVVRLAAHLYTHRADDGDGGPPAAVTALWRPWRRVRL